MAISADRGGKEVMMAATVVVCSMRTILYVFGERKKWRDNKEKQACVLQRQEKRGFRYLLWFSSKRSVGSRDKIIKVQFLEKRGY